MVARRVAEAMEGERCAFTVMAKVVGGLCNLRCTYCYYSEKPGLLAQEMPRMSDEVLESYVNRVFDLDEDGQAEFVWSGGEPLLAGLPFFERAMELQERRGGGAKNSIRTNGTLLDDGWCDLLAKHGFHVEVCIDGPKELNDVYRVGHDGGTFDKVMAGVDLLKKHGVRFGALARVHAANESHPREVYGFLRGIADRMQFTPVVEREAAFHELEDGQCFSMPPGIKGPPVQSKSVEPFSVSPEGFGSFLAEVFDSWMELDGGLKTVVLFDATARNMLGNQGGTCAHNPLCGHGVSVEVNGDVYSCERYAYPKYKLGNLLETPLSQIVERNRPFCMNKTEGLPDDCFDCPYITLCFGGCPSHRIVPSEDGLRGKNYLCEGYKKFFSHFIENMQQM